METVLVLLLLVAIVGKVVALGVLIRCYVELETRRLEREARSAASAGCSSARRPVNMDRRDRRNETR